jgi:hypothetical protein
VIARDRVIVVKNLFLDALLITNAQKDLGLIRIRARASAVPLAHNSNRLQPLIAQ